VERAGQTLHDFLPDLGAPDVVSLAASDETSKAIEAYRAAELERARPGSARRAVLENLHDLLDGEVHMKDVAATAGLGAPALCEARASVIAEIRRLPAVRCHDPNI
jgi:acyl-CoA reductase-like NAD-dependent aldehyde dehydrogenase